MKRLLLGMLSALVFVLPIPTMAGVNVDIGISLPPPIVFATPPEVVVLPGSYVYAVPDSNVDIFFYGGWWWRPWEGRWYRSHNYDSGWGYYRSVPSFYAGIPSGWRNDYRNHRWEGHRWNYQRIPHQQLHRNWNNWEKSRHWEKQQTWGVQGLKHRPQSREIRTNQSRPQSREIRTNQSRPQTREVRTNQSRPQTREARPQHSQPQHRDAPQQSAPRQGNHENRGGEKQNRN